MERVFKYGHHIVRKIIFYSISLINLVIPKNSKWIFFSDTSVVRDNQYILLKYMVENAYTNNYEIFFYAEDDTFIEENIKKEIHIIKGKISGLYYRFTSKYVFFAFGSNFMSCESPKKQITVDLWHGFGMKKIEYTISESKHSIPIEKTFNKVLISSNFFNSMIKKSLHCKDEQIFISGAPKLDELYMENDVFEILGIKKRYYKKIVFYLPTYRNSKRLGFEGHSSELPLLSEYDIDEINQYLSKRKIFFIIKLHHTAQRDASINIVEQKLSNISFLSNDDFNQICSHFYCALGQADALITDYSSVYQDFLLTGKPIGFVIKDIEEYSKIRGFNFDNPLDIMPGHYIRNKLDLFVFLDDLVNDKDLYKEKRSIVNNLMNTYQGKENCKELLVKLGIKND